MTANLFLTLFSAVRLPYYTCGLVVSPCTLSIYVSNPLIMTVLFVDLCMVTAMSCHHFDVLTYYLWFKSSQTSLDAWISIWPTSNEVNYPYY